MFEVTTGAIEEVEEWPNSVAFFCKEVPGKVSGNAHRQFEHGLGTMSITVFGI